MNTGAAPAVKRQSVAGVSAPTVAPFARRRCFRASRNRRPRGGRSGPPEGVMTLFAKIGAALLAAMLAGAAATGPALADDAPAARRRSGAAQRRHREIQRLRRLPQPHAARLRIDRPLQELGQLDDGADRTRARHLRPLRRLRHQRRSGEGDRGHDGGAVDARTRRGDARLYRRQRGPGTDPHRGQRLLRARRLQGRQDGRRQGAARRESSPRPARSSPRAPASTRSSATRRTRSTSNASPRSRRRRAGRRAGTSPT